MCCQGCGPGHRDSQGPSLLCRHVAAQASRALLRVNAWSGQMQLNVSPKEMQLPGPHPDLQPEICGWGLGIRICDRFPQ